MPSGLGLPCPGGLGWLHGAAAGRLGAQRFSLAWQPWQELQLPCQRGASSSALQPALPQQRLRAGTPEILSTGSRAAALAWGHKGQMQHKYSVRCFPALPAPGCCHCCKSFHNKAHAHPQPRHTPAQPEPSTAFPTKLLEGFCHCGAIWDFI